MTYLQTMTLSLITFSVITYLAVLSPYLAGFISAVMISFIIVRYETDKKE